MESLHRRSDSLLSTVTTAYERPLLRLIDWSDPLILLLGPRGVGKTTLLVQRLKALDLPPSKALYIDMGDLYFRENRLINFIEIFIAQGGTTLLIDEIHRYGHNTWAAEIKQAYDLYRSKLNLVVTGSSVVKIVNEQADLSRRALKYRMAGLSFREYLLLKNEISLPTVSIEEITKKQKEISRDILSSANFTPVAALHEYWLEGYYPYFLERRSGYVSRLLDSVQTVLEHDIPYGTDANASDPHKLGKLLYAIASSAPFTPNINKISQRTNISRPTLANYLRQLENAHLITSLRQEGKGISTLGKPDKIYLDNPNLAAALAPGKVDVGTQRETFFLSQIKQLTFGHPLFPPEITLPKKGDFVFQDRDDRYLFEIGGPNKSRKQISGEQSAFTVVDTDRSGEDDRIPLWLFGLLY